MECNGRKKRGTKKGFPSEGLGRWGEMQRVIGSEKGPNLSRFQCERLLAPRNRKRAHRETTVSIGEIGGVREKKEGGSRVGVWG